MDDPEVEHGVEGLVGGVDGGHIAHGERHPLRCVTAEATASLVNHFGVEVEGGDVAGPEAFDDEFGADPASAAHLEDGSTVDGPSEAF